MANGDKLQRFTQRARRVLALAQEEAERLSHNYIGTEHCCSGLSVKRTASQGGCCASSAQNPTAFGDGRTHDRRRPPHARLSASLTTPRTKQVIEFAVDEARKLGHSFISTEHLLLGLIRQGDGVAIDVLRQIGLTPERIRRETLHAVQQEQTTEGGQGQSDAAAAPPPRLDDAARKSARRRRRWTSWPPI